MRFLCTFSNQIILPGYQYNHVVHIFVLKEHIIWTKEHELYELKSMSYMN